MPDAITFKEVELGFEISSECGTTMVCNGGEDVTFPSGTALLTRMWGGDEIKVLDTPIPLGDLFSDLSYLMPYDGKFYVYWIHSADYEPVVRMLKELGAAQSRGEGLRVRSPIARRGRNSIRQPVDQKARANPINKKNSFDQN